MNNKSFIQGLLYGLAYYQAVENIKNNKESCVIDAITLWFTNGENFIFSTNKAFPQTCLSFITVEDTYLEVELKNLTSEQYLTVCQVVEYWEWDAMGCSLPVFYQVIDELGVIDVEKTNEETLKWYKTKTSK